jgi:tellurite resistance protein TerB
MGLFDFLKSVKEQVNKNLNPDYAKNTDFLEAMAASAALVAAADGVVDDAEKSATISIMMGHPQLGKLYAAPVIQKTAQTMLDRTGTFSGRQQLQRELQDLNDKGAATQMKEDVLYMAIDIASADGNISDPEKKIIESIASKFKLQVPDLSQA